MVQAHGEIARYGKDNAMFHKSDEPSPSVEGRSLGASGGPSPWRQRLLLLVGVVCLTAAAYRVIDRWMSPAPPVPEPAEWGQVEPFASAYLQERVGWVRESPRDWERHAVLGLAYAANGLWELAVTGFENASRLNPAEPLAVLYRAIALEFSGQIGEALAAYGDVTRRFPGFAPGFSRLGEALLRHGDLEESAGAFGRLIELQPEEWRGYAGLAEVRMRQESLEEALRLGRQAVEKAAGVGAAHHLLGQVYERLGRSEEARREGRLGVSSIRPPLPDEWAIQAPLHMRRQNDVIALAQDLLQNGQTGRAVTMLEAALVFDPDSLPLLTTLGLAHQQAGQGERASAFLERALGQSATHVPALVALAATRLREGNIEAARELAGRAALEAPDLPQPHLIAANIALSDGRDDDAIAALERALAIAPESGGIHMDIANILLVNQGRAEAALDRYRQALAIEPDLILAHVRIAQILLQTGQTNEALESIRTARRLAPEDPNLAAFEAAIQDPPAGDLPDAGSPPRPQ